MNENKVKLIAVDGETLMDMDLPQTKFCVQTLLPQGMVILGGAPKIGKSWLVLDLCVRIAKGESIWNLETHKGTTLYLCLENTLQRIQNRLACITDEVPANAFFATAAGTLADGLCEQIREFIKEHPDTVFVAIDTFQMIRNNTIDTSYGNDYADIIQMKKLADELGISLLLVHHLRKQGDSDPLNKLSGTTGICGAVDAVFVLDKSRRSATDATMVCTGRDIEDRELELRRSKESCVWKLISDSMDNPEMLLPEEMNSLIEMMKITVSYTGSNSDFTEQYNDFTGKNTSAKSLKQMMNRWKYQLEKNGVKFKSYRSNGRRLINISFSAGGDSSAVSDEINSVCDLCVPSVPCDPVKTDYSKCNGDAFIEALAKSMEKQCAEQGIKNKPFNEVGGVKIIFFSVVKFLTVAPGFITEYSATVLKFRVTPEQKKLIEQKALSSYMLTSMYLRDCALEKEITVINGLDGIENELRRIGNNLNQLTRLVNSGMISAVDLTKTRQEVAAVWQSLSSLFREVQ